MNMDIVGTTSPSPASQQFSARTSSMLWAGDAWKGEMQAHQRQADGKQDDGSQGCRCANSPELNEAWERRGTWAALRLMFDVPNCSHKGWVTMLGWRMTGPEDDWARLGWGPVSTDALTDLLMCTAQCSGHSLMPSALPHC